MRRAAPALLALALARPGAARALSPFLAEEPNVRQGNARLSSGDAAGALERYRAAEERAGARPEIDYDRGDALYRLGRTPEAIEAWRRAGQRAPAALGSRASQNEGTALAAAGDRDGAIAALTEALRLDPGNEDARFDLEVLLRRKQEEERKAGPGGGPPPPQAGGGSRDARQPDEPPPGADPDRREQAAQAGAPRSPAAAGRGDRDRGAAGGPEASISSAEAERILDAFRSRERALPRESERRRARRADGDRDW
ncbi:MAG TPA: hypothetical protein VMU15_12410 [Anaeromyxobacter sp.]|nr:hypothetical protein [Anaeromyxobacter sp.]